MGLADKEARWPVAGLQSHLMQEECLGHPLAGVMTGKADVLSRGRGLQRSLLCTWGSPRQPEP